MNRDEMIKFIIDCVAQTYRADAAGISESTNIPEVRDKIPAESILMRIDRK